MRYRDGFKEQGRRTKLKNHWATPDAYIKALQDGLSVCIERFASPLNFTPSMASYFSLFEADQALGANHDAFSCKWIGASQCNPEYEARDMERAVRWAICSARDSEEASLTAFVLPYWETTSYFQWLSHKKWVHILARIPKKQFKFKRPDLWKQQEMYASHPKWDVLIFVVANDAGIRKFVKPDALRAGFSAASLEIGNTPISVRVPCVRGNEEGSGQHGGGDVYRPKAMNRLDQQGTPRQLVTWRDGREHTAPSTFQRHDAYPRLVNADALWYTDGSVRETEGAQMIGAGVFCKARNIAAIVDCGGLGATNTINRAEMCGINYCLQQTATDKDEIIATDSLVCMFSLNRELHAPARNRFSKHRELVHDTHDKVVERARQRLHTHIVKVKAHTGVCGNERADELAKQATDRERYSPTGAVLIGQHAYEGLAWPCHLPQEHTEGEQVLHDRRAVSDLNGALKRAAAERYGTGHTKDTLYTTLWKDILPYLDRQASNGFCKSTAISFPAKKQVYKARYGQTWNMRKACIQRRPYRKGEAVPNHIRCPLCGQDDSTGHILGGCLDKDMKSIYIERHNQAARMILTEINRGAYGNRMVCLDVGSNPKVAHLNGGPAEIPKTIISDAVLEKNGIAPTDRQKLRPDALIIESNEVHIPVTGKRCRGAERRKVPRRCIHDPELDPPFRPCKAYIIEVGFGSETRYKEKVQQKVQQHKQLCQLLQDAGFEPVIQPIILGTTGGIFESQNQLLAELGVEVSRRTKLNAKLHERNIAVMHNIVKLRQVKESKEQSRSGQWRKKPPDKWN